MCPGARPPVILVADVDDIYDAILGMVLSVNNGNNWDPMHGDQSTGHGRLNQLSATCAESENRPIQSFILNLRSERSEHY